MAEKEYIEREAVCYQLAKQATIDGQPRAIRRAAKIVANIPAADVRPVVLCRDCKHKGWIQEPEHGKSVDYCRLIERCVDKQFFCAAGECKTNCGADMRGEQDV